MPERQRGDALPFGDISLSERLSATTITGEVTKAALARLVAEMDTTDTAARYKVRAALNAKMQDVIERIELTSDDHAYVYLRNLPGTRYAFCRGRFVGVRRYQDLIVDGMPVRDQQCESVVVPSKVRGPRGGFKHDDNAKEKIGALQRERLAKRNRP